jgi:hypothetical protein
MTEAMKAIFDKWTGRRQPSIFEPSFVEVSSCYLVQIEGLSCGGQYALLRFVGTLSRLFCFGFRAWVLLQLRLYFRWRSTFTRSCGSFGITVSGVQETHFQRSVGSGGKALLFYSQGAVLFNMEISVAASCYFLMQNFWCKISVDASCYFLMRKLDAKTWNLHQVFSGSDYRDLAKRLASHPGVCDECMFQCRQY